MAKALTSLSVKLWDLGRRESALEAAQEAVAIYRRLVKANPGAFQAALIIGLSNLSVMLVEQLGRREAAKEVAREAVAIYRQLAKTNPAAPVRLGKVLANLALTLDEPYLAMELSNLSATLGDSSGGGVASTE